MSQLRVLDDDHADAAGKHWGDTNALLAAERYDGAAYLSGYVVECSLKAVILHDQSFNPTTGRHDATQLAHWHRRLSKHPYGHNINTLAAMTVGPEGALYLPDIPSTATILAWRETSRYSAPKPVATAQAQARAYHEWSGMIYECSVVKMKANGVI